MEQETTSKTAVRPPKRPGILLTAGYQGADPTVFAHIRSQFNALILDIRQMPHARDKRWSKRGLTRKFRDDYQHATGLGNINYKLPGAAVKLAYPEPWIELIVNHLRRGRNVMLLCYEAEYHFCHRTDIALLVVQRAIAQDIACEVRHLAPATLCAS